MYLTGVSREETRSELTTYPTFKIETAVLKLLPTRPRSSSKEFSLAWLNA